MQPRFVRKVLMMFHVNQKKHWSLWLVVSSPLLPGDSHQILGWFLRKAQKSIVVTTSRGSFYCALLAPASVLFPVNGGQVHSFSESGPNLDRVYYPSFFLTPASSPTTNLSAQHPKYIICPESEHSVSPPQLPPDSYSRVAWIVARAFWWIFFIPVLLVYSLLRQQP